MNEFLITGIQIAGTKPGGEYYSLILQKNNGGHWAYKLRGELTMEEITLLKMRRPYQTEGLGVAKFTRIKTKKGECLHLTGLGL